MAFRRSPVRSRSGPPNEQGITGGSGGTRAARLLSRSAVSIPNPQETIVSSGGPSLARGSAILATAQIAAQACAADQAIAVAGAPAGSPCIVGAPSALAAGLVLSCFVSAAGSVALRVCNHTAAPITPAGSQIVNILVLP